MRHPIQLKIIDHDSVLSDVDLHQVENIIWLEFAPVYRNIEWVTFKITRLDHSRFGREHVVQIAIQLKSKKVVESRTTRISKGAVLISSVADMRALVERRRRFEASWFYRSIRAIRSVLDLLVGTSEKVSKGLGGASQVRRLDTLSLASTKHTSNARKPST